MVFTLMDSHEVSRSGSLSSFDAIGSEAKPSDWAVLTGAGIEQNGNGYYWLRDKGLLAVHIVAHEGNVLGLRGNVKKKAGIRPFLTPDEAQKIMGSAKQISTDVYEYGEYPQSVEDDEAIIDELNENYNSLPEAGMSYTTNDPDEEGFSPVQHPVYEYAGARYVRIDADVFEKNTGTLSNGNKPEQDKVYWVRVEPVRWVRGKDGSMLSEKTLAGGVPFGDGDFEDSFAKEFLNDHFEAELCQTIGKNVVKENAIDKMMEEIEKEEQEEVKKEEEQKMDPNAPKKKKPFILKVNKKPMTIEEQIASYVRTGDSIMLHGFPGVGKTERVKAADPDLVSVAIPNGVMPEEIHGRTMYTDKKLFEQGEKLIGRMDNIVDALERRVVGIEKDEKGRDIPKLVVDLPNGGEWVAPHWYNAICDVCKDGKKHILFIDELTNARETTQSLIFNLVLNRTIDHNIGKLPDNAVVVCAGNEPTDSASAYNMPAPLFDRFQHIHIPLDMDAWLRWGSLLDNSAVQKDENGNVIKDENGNPIEVDYERHNVHPLVASYVAAGGEKRLFKAYVEDPAERTGKERDPTYVYSLSPRRWKKLSDKLYNDGEARLEIIQAAIGKEEGEKFMKYLESNPVTLDQILDGSAKRIPVNPDEQLALIYSCRYVSEGEDVKKVRDFIRKNFKDDELSNVFESVWVHNKDAARKGVRKDMYKNISTMNGGR